MKRVLVIGGPTGSGESTITQEVIKKYPIFKRLVTATSRSPRGNEKNGIDYYFFLKEEFEKQIEKGNIIEYTYIDNRDTYYGSYKPDLEKKLNDGFNVIVNVDIVGAKYYREKYQATTIFIKPSSLEELGGRLVGRDQNINKEELEKRLRNAESEINNEMKYYDYIIVNANGKLKDALNEITSILKQEKYALK